MPKLKIDDREVEVESGATILEAARKLGIEVPTLCYRKENPSPSCMACLVMDGRTRQFVPSCSAQAMDGMEIESDSAEVREARKTAIELILSDHLGDCVSPCQRICPADLGIPLVMKQIDEGRLSEAIVTIKSAIALPATLSRICHRPCESGCRRRSKDSPISIRELVRHVADWDLGREDPYRPKRKPDTRKRVAIAGAGPTGLSAAYYLLLNGHSCTLFESADEPGGSLLAHVEGGEVPQDVLSEEVSHIEELGAEIRLKTKVGREVSLGDLCGEFDAVLFAGGGTDTEEGESLGLQTTQHGLKIDKATFETSVQNVFAAGHAVRKTGKAVHSIADGRAAAEAISQRLAAFPILGKAKPFSCHIGKLKEDEIEEFMPGVSESDRAEASGPDEALTIEQALGEVHRCVKCNCAKAGNCTLRELAEDYGAKQDRFKGDRRVYEKAIEHPYVLFEPGKCIRCGNCVKIAESQGEALGLTFVGRGFDVRIGVPFDGTLDEALKATAAACVEACPTGALTLKEEAGTPSDD